MSEKQKKSTLPPIGSVSEILKAFGDIGGAAMIAKAIREHTRAMVALEFRMDKTNIDKKAWDLADSFLAAGKRPEPKPFADDDLHQPNP